jgi:SAM-dependent methyltransferase
LTEKTKEDWASLVYETKASIYRSVLEAGLKTAPGEVKGIVKLFKSHGIHAGSDILDVACGIGRHSVYLAKAGFRVTGIDPSYTFLARARALAAKEGVSQKVHFAHGRFSNLLDVLSRRKPREFNGIIIMDYSIGVTGRDEDDLLLFRDLSVVAAKGALLTVEIFDRNWFVERAGPTLTEEFPDNLVRVWKRVSKPGSRVLDADWAFYRKQPGQSLKHLFTTRARTRHYTVAELRVLAKKAGWKYLACYGSLEDLHRFTRSDSRAFMIFRSNQRRSVPAEARRTVMHGEKRFQAS